MQASFFKWTFLASLLALIQCTDGTAPQPVHSPVSLFVTPDSVSLHIGQSLQMHLVVLDSVGDTLPSDGAAWSSSDTAVVTISPTGLALGRGSGTAIISANLDSIIGTAYLRILIPVQQLGLSPYVVNLVPGGSIQLKAALQDRDGNPLSDRDVTWLHQTSAITIEASTGILTGLAEGRDSITAISEGVPSWDHVIATVTRPRFARVISNGLADHTCAISTDGDAYCWGSNTAGELGNGTYGDSLGRGAFWARPSDGGLSHPTGVPFPIPSDLGVGEGMTCAVYGATGQVVCWGFNDEGAFATDAPQSSATPLPVTVGRPAISVVVGEEWACALGTDSIPYCWGGSVTGFLRPPTASSRRKYVAIVAGYKTLCGIAVDSLAYCGYPRPPDQTAVSPTLKFTKLAAGYDHACGIAADSIAYCWGQNFLGQLGDSTTIGRLTPGPVVGGYKFVDLAVGFEFTCGILAGSGAGYCWGLNHLVPEVPPYAEITTFPIPVPGSLTFSQITAGVDFACGIANGKVYCWGENRFGHLGDGTTTGRYTPTLVVGQQP